MSIAVAAVPEKGRDGALTGIDETTSGGGGAFGGGAMTGASIAGAPATRPHGGGADISSTVGSDDPPYVKGGNLEVVDQVDFEFSGNSAD